MDHMVDGIVDLLYYLNYDKLIIRMVGFMVSFMLIFSDKAANADHYFRSCGT